MFFFRLAEHLGKTVTELKHQAGASEIRDWMIYFRARQLEQYEYDMAQRVREKHGAKGRKTRN